MNIENLGKIVEEDKFITQQKQNCKDVKVIIFRFILQETQVNVIYILFFEK